MASTLSEKATLIEANTDLKDRMGAALVTTAWYVVGAEAPEVQDHANRLALAKKVCLNWRAMIDKYYVLCLSNGDMLAAEQAATDAQLQYVADALFTAIANLEAAA